MSIIYATRSILPSKTANSVQSAHMAEAWERFLSGLPVIYRTERFEESALEHFMAYSLDAPRGAKAIPVRFLDDFFHTYLLSFVSFLKQCSPTASVYTRSTRMAWVAARAGRVVVLELHDPLIPIRIAVLKKWIGLGRIPLLVVTTERLKLDVIEQVGIAPDKVFVAGGAAALDYVNVPAASLSQNDQASYHVGYAGSALKGKGVRIVLACARKMPDVTFHLIGPNRRECDVLGGAGANVVLHGYHVGQHVIALLKAMDVLLLPNQPSVIIRSGADIGQHTSPLKLFEYMAVCRPIIASDLPVFDGILRDSENALRVPATNVGAFCAAIRRVQKEPGFANSLAETALGEFKEKYTWDQRVRKIGEFIETNGISIHSS